MGVILALEVVEGPMDGLKCILTDRMTSAGIGRQVGNSLTLAVDMAVSRRHARVSLEGPSWCIEDLSSTGGLWVSGGREKKSVLLADQVILLGSTIIEVFVPEGSGAGVGIGEECFQDPRQVYGMSPGMEAVWRSFYQGEERKVHCDVSGVFAAWAGLQERSIQQYESVMNICSPDNWKCLGAWNGNLSESAGKDVTVRGGQKMLLNAGGDFIVKGGKKGMIDIKDQLTIKVGKASIIVKKNGDITINGKNLNMKGSGNVVIKGKKIMGN